MVLELYVWGPAFGLPSIDAECLAAIAYLRHCLNDGEWVLVASSDTSVSPTSTFYALQLQG
jgi:sorting and assembly machinery component 37